jgi:hypothetical protein
MNGIIVIRGDIDIYFYNLGEDIDTIGTLGKHW